VSWADKFPLPEALDEPGDSPGRSSPEWEAWRTQTAAFNNAVLARRKHMIAKDLDLLLVKAKAGELSAAEGIALNLGLSVLDGALTLKAPAVDAIEAIMGMFG
jgi:hypothetical protein